MEIKFIQLYNSYNRGYNCDKGGKQGTVSNSVYQFSLEGTLIKVWNSVREACENLNFRSGNNIRAAIRGKKTQHTAYDFIWSFKNDGIQRAKNLSKSLELAFIRRTSQNSKEIRMYDIRGRFITKFRSVKDCASHLGVSSSGLSAAIMTSRGISNKVILLKSGEDIEDILNELKPRRYFTKYRPVLRKSLKSGEVKFYETLEQASIDSNIPMSYITPILYGKRKSTNGYYWKFQD